MKPLLILALCLFVLPSCAGTWRAVGASPTADMEDHRKEENKTLREIVDVLVDAMSQRIQPYEVKPRVAAILNKQEDDWVNRPEPSEPFPWTEVIGLVVGTALASTGTGMKILNNRRNRTRQRELQARDESIAETDKWVEEIEKKSQPRA